MLDFLPPEGPGLVAVGHPRFDGAGHDPFEAAEVVVAIREPGIHHIGCAHVLHPDGAIRLPGLLEGLPDPLGRAAVPAVHRARLDDDVLDPSVGDLLHVPLRHVGRVMVRRPRGQRAVLFVCPRSSTAQVSSGAHELPSRTRSARRGGGRDRCGPHGFVSCDQSIPRGRRFTDARAGLSR